MEQNIPYLSAIFVLLLLHSHHFLDNPLEDQNVELKEGNRPYEPHESFFFFSFDNDNHAWLFSLTNSISTTNTINIQIRKLANALFVNDYLTYQYGFATD